MTTAKILTILVLVARVAKALAAGVAGASVVFGFAAAHGIPVDAPLLLQAAIAFFVAAVPVYAVPNAAPTSKAA